MTLFDMTRSEITELKGKALTDLAAAVAIPGRSKMKADELRAALEAEWDVQHPSLPEDADADKTFTENGDGSWTEVTGPPADAVWETVAVVPAEAVEPEKWEVVPNRAQRREAARRARKARGRIAQKQNRNN